VKKYLNDNGMIKVPIKDKAVKFDMLINERTGFLTVNAVIARTGIQEYFNSELGEEGTGIVGVFRPTEEVTSKKSMDSFVNVPVTDDHPSEMVTVDNIQKYSKGSISSVIVVQLDGESALQTILTITDKDLIALVQSGKKELSVGYENVLVQKEGKYKGKDYRYIQTDIFANHIAVVDAGRCGGICSLALDKKIKKGDIAMKITIGENEYEVVEEVAEEIKRLKSATEKMDELEEEVKDTEESLDKMTAKYDSLKTEKKALSKKVDDSASMMNDAVSKKIDLVTFAKDCNVEVKTSDDNLEIKRAIVKSFGLDTDGKSEAYLDAAMDIRKVSTEDKSIKKANAMDSINKVGTEYKPNATLDAVAIGNRIIGGKK